MATVDSLEVKIEADASRASSALDKLVVKLDSVAKLLGSINVNSISAGINKLTGNLSDINKKGFENLNKSAKEVENTINKVSDTAKKGINTKLNYDVSDYESVIKRLGAKFSDAEKGLKAEGNLTALEQQAAKLSKHLDDLASKEEKIISVGKMSPESTVFQNLQYDISATINKIGDLQNQINAAKNLAQSMDNVKIRFFDENSFDVNESVQKAQQIITNAFENMSKKPVKIFDESAMAAVFGETASGINNMNDAVARFGENAGAVMNSLSIEKIQGDARNYTQEIADATNKLKELEQSGAGMGSAQWDNAYMALQKLKQEAAEYKAQLDKPTTGIENDINKTNSLGNRVEELQNRLKELKAQGLNFGDTDFNKVYTQLQKAEGELKEYKAELSGAGKAASSFAEMSTPPFQRVTNLINKMNLGISSAVKRIGSMINPFKSASASSGGLVKNFGKLFIAFQSLRGLGNIIKNSMDISSSLTEVQNVVDVTFGKFKNKMEDFAKVSIPEFGMSELTAKQIGSRFQAMGTAIGFSQGKMSDMSIELTKLTADMASFYDVEQNDVAKSLQSVFTGTTMPLRKYGLDLTNATLEEWAHKQGIDAKMRSMTQAEKTMLRYQYVMAQTGAAQGDFARTADTWANQVRVLKQNFEQLGSVLGGTFINALKPLVKSLNVIIGQVTEFAKTISNALGKIFGWTYEESGKGGVAQDFEDAEDAAGGIADSTDKTAKAMKKVQQGLRAFDELKLINLPDKDKGKDKGSSGTGAGAGGGQWKPTESILKPYESDIKTLEQLGSKISDALSTAMEKIKWQDVYQKARNFGSGLASFLNGLIKPRLFSNIGTTLAGVLNTVLHFLDSFGETFNWKNFGNSLAMGLNSFLKGIDWATALSAAKNWGTGIAKALNAFISPETFGNVGEAVANALNVAIQFVLNLGMEFDFKNLGNSLATGVNKFFKTFSFTDLANAINTWVKGALKAASTFLKKTDFKIIGTKIGKFLSDLDIKGIAKGLAEVIYEGIKGSLTLLSNMIKQAPIETVLLGAFAFFKFTKIGNKVATNIFKSVKGSLDSAVKKSGIAENVNSLIGNIAQIGVTGFAEFSAVSGAVEDLAKGVGDVGSNIGTLATSAVTAGVSFTSVLGFPAGVVATAIVGLTGAIDGINSKMKEIDAEEMGDAIEEALTEPGGTPISEIATGVSDAIKGIGDSFTIITEKSAGLEQADSNIEDTWMEIEKIETAMESGVLSVEEGKIELERLFGELAQEASDKFGALETTLLAAFGENGVLTEVFNRLGITTDGLMTTTMKLHEDAKKRIEELTTTLATTDPSNPNYEKYKEELAGLMSQTDELSESVSNYDLALSQIDLSKLIKGDGSIDETALQEALGKISGAVETANTDVEVAVGKIKTSLNDDLNLALQLGDMQSAEEIQTKLDALPEALNLLKGDVSSKAVELVATIEDEYIKGVSGVIDNAQTTWEEKSSGAKFWESLFGSGDVDGYANDTVKKYKESFDTVNDTIKSSLGTMADEVTAESSDKFKEIYDNLFYEDLVSTPHATKTVTKLKENWKEIMKEMGYTVEEESKNLGRNGADVLDKEINKGAKNAGEKVGPSVNQGVSSKTKETKEKVKSFADTVKSPLSAIAEAGKEAGEKAGLDVGDEISDAQDSTTAKVSTFSDKVVDALSKIGSSGAEIGKNVITGMKDGIDDNKQSLFDKMKGVADAVVKVAKGALEIHSPSKVMFEIGSYTMEGFQEGLQDWYNPILSSVKSFSHEVSLAPAPELSNLYNGRTITLNTASAYEPLKEHENANRMSNAETNMLLRRQNELLEAILAKPGINNSDIFKAAKTVYKGEATRRYGDSSAFDPVWG